ncbi:hypothetical protein HR12_30905 [Microbacterium sp. SUBG005]|nr:hypothetical protein HR12_30905 [Microbacterium sp. SUBG005]
MGGRKGIADAADQRYLRGIWNREIAKQLSDLKFSSHNFVVDPLQGAVIARNIYDFIGQLSRDLTSGAYAPRRGVILRSAKKLGISRGKVVEAVPSEVKEAIRSISTAHRDLVTRPDRWSRVTRRLYTLHRRLDVKDRGPHWTRDLADDPAGAAIYFEYFRSWPLTQSGIATVGAAVDGFHGLYSDVEVMFAEAVATAPVANDPDLWGAVFAYAAGRFSAQAKMPNGDGNIASAWFVSAIKYGNKQQRASTVDKAIKWCASSIPSVIMQVATFKPDVELAKTLPPALYGPDEAIAADFFRRLDFSDTRTINVVRGQLTPRHRPCTTAGDYSSKVRAGSR